MTTIPPADNKYRVPEETPRLRVVIYDLPSKKSRTMTIYNGKMEQVVRYLQELIKLDL